MRDKTNHEYDSKCNCIDCKPIVIAPTNHETNEVKDGSPTQDYSRAMKLIPERQSFGSRLLCFIGSHDWSDGAGLPCRGCGKPDDLFKKQRDICKGGCGEHCSACKPKEEMIHEDQLPPMTDEQYAEWFKTSRVVDGVRMGRKVTK